MAYGELTTQLCGQQTVTTEEVDALLRSYINDEIESGELALLSESEVYQYLSVSSSYRTQAAQILIDVAKLDVTASGCQPRAPLFADNVKRVVLQMGEALERGEPVDLDYLATRWKLTALSHGTPDDEFIDAIIKTIVGFGVSIPGLDERLADGLEATHVRAYVHYEPGNFVPPKRLFSDDLSGPSQRALQAVSELYVKEAWRRAFDLAPGKPTKIGGKSFPGSPNYDDSALAKRLAKAYPDFSVHVDPTYYREVNLWIDIDAKKVTDGKISKDEIKKQVEAIVAEVEKAVAEKLKEVMANPPLAQGLMDAADLAHELEVGIALKRAVTRIDRQRDLIETPEERTRFVEMLTKLVGALGDDFKDVEVALLRSSDAVMGYEGIYEGTDQPGKKSHVRVPMTRYGTTQHLEMDEVLKILAHELAHHKVRKSKAAAQGVAPDHRSHSLDHTVVTEEILLKLMSSFYLMK